MRKILVLLGFSVLLLSGCVASDGPTKSSPEKHATRYANGVVNVLPVSRSDVYENILPFLTSIYHEGKEDRVEGIPEPQAKEKRNSYYSPVFFKGYDKHYGDVGIDLENKEKGINYRLKDLLAREASATYWDGYMGR
ncbi:Exc2 family lipoprotein [Serratia marcescens]|uniref:Exc2 family lipoprotein n=1 Tax=Serratia marcescens TaxID=615 RepID=UPI003FA73C8A